MKILTLLLLAFSSWGLAFGQKGELQRPVKLSESPELAGLLNNPKRTIPGTSLDLKAVGSTLVVRMQNRADEEYQAALASDRYAFGLSLYFDDTVFSRIWHKTVVPIGVTTIFVGDDDMVYGWEADTFYEYGWNLRINPDSFHTRIGFYTTLREGDVLERRVPIGDLQREFRRRFGQGGRSGYFYFFVKISLVKPASGGFKTDDVLYSYARVRGKL